MKRLKHRYTILSLALLGFSLHAASVSFTQKPELYAQWLMYAETDIKAAHTLSEFDDLRGPVLYHAQQSVEKALKAFLIYKQRPVEKTHNLLDLTKACMAVDESFKALQPAAAELSPYATISRYPNESFCADAMKVESAMKQALSILKTVKAKLVTVIQ